jgi:hypothetical protein
MANEEAEVKTTEVTENAEVKATEQESTTPQYTAIEQRAMEMGWRPKEEFSGDEDDFIDAKEFVRRKPLFDKIEHQSKELKDVKKILRSLQDHHVKLKETEFNRAVEYLKAQKKEALSDGNLDLVVELDDKLVDIRAAQKAAIAAEVQVKPNQPHPDFVSWVDKNTWYAQDNQLRSFADNLGIQYAEENPELSPKDVLKYVSDRVRRAFPEKFQNPNRTKPAPVDGGSPVAKPTKSSDTFQLTEEEERVVKSFVRAGIMSREDYVKELKAMRG